MRVECPKCNAGHELSVQVPVEGMSYVCTSCAHVFHVAGKADKYMIQRPSGKKLGPFPVRVVEQMVRSKQIKPDAGVSADGKTYTPIAEHPDFALLFDDLPAAKLGSLSLDDLPAPSGFDGDLLDFGGAEADLPSAKGSLGLSGLPSLKTASGLSTPKSTQGGLPIAKSAGNSSGLPTPKSMGLPVPKAAGLPVPRTAGLPVPKTAGLPVSKAGGLPVPRSSDLPAARGADLPTAKDTPTPSPIGGPASPFGIQPNDKTPVPDAKTPMPGPRPQHRGLDALRDDHDELNLGAGSARTSVLGSFSIDGDGELPMMHASDLPTLGSGQSEDLPIMDVDASPLYGNPSGSDDLSMDQNLLLGSELLDYDSGMGSDKQPDLLGGSELDLLDDDLGMGMHMLDEADPFGMDQARPTPQDDDPLGLGLGGPGADEGDPFRFGLESSSHQDRDPLGLDTGSKAPSASPGAVFGADDDPLGLNDHVDDNPFGAPMGTEPAAPAAFSPFDDPLGSDGEPSLIGSGPSLAMPDTARSSSYNDKEDEDEEDDDLFDLDVPQRAAAPAATAPETVPTAALDKKHPKPAASGSNTTKLLLAAVVLAVLVVVGLGFTPYGLFSFGGHEEGAPSSEQAPTGSDKPVVASDLTADALRPDTFAGYQAYIETATAAADSSGTPRAQGLALGGIALALVRYPELQASLEPKGLELLKDLQGAEPSKWLAFGEGGWLAYKGDLDGAEKHLGTLVNHPDLAYFGDLLRGIAAMQSAGLQSDQDARKETFEKAIGTLQRAQGTSGGGPAADFLLGDALEAAGKPSQAMRTFTKALEAHPNHVGMRLSLARLRTATGDLDGAKEHFTLVLEKLAEAASPTEKAQAHELAGRHTMMRNDLDLAIEEFKKALVLSPDLASALEGLGECYVRAQRFQEGIDFFEQTFGALPKSLEVKLAMTRAYLGLAAEASDADVVYARAREILDAGRRDHDGDARFPYFLGLLFEAEERFSEAEASYQTAIDVDRNYALAKIRLARLLATKGTPEADLKASELVSDVQSGLLSADELTELARLFLAKEESDAAVEALTQATEQNASWVPAHELLVEHFIATNQPERSAKHLEILKRLNALTPHLRYLNAKAHYLEEEYKDAIELMADVIAEEPENAEYLNFLGEVYFARKAFPTAERYFEDALGAEPNLWEARFFIGRCELEQDHAEEALKVFRRVHDERPTNGEYHFYLARALDVVGRRNEAQREYNSVIQRGGDPEVPESMFVLTSPLPLFHRGVLLRTLGRRGKAEQDLTAALAIDPTFVPAREELAKVLYESKQLASAASELEKVRTATEGEMKADLYYILGLSYYSLNQFEQAVVALETARDRGYAESGGDGILAATDPAEVHRILGFIYREIGRKGDAVTELELYLKKAKELGRSQQRDIEFIIGELR